MTPVDLTLLGDSLLFAIREDVGSGDITSRATIPADTTGLARIAAKQALTVAGLPVAAEVVRLVDRPAWAFDQRP